MLSHLSRLTFSIIGISLIANACIKPANNATNVYGGVEDIKTNPSSVMISVTRSDGTIRTCGGAFISDKSLLTSALCLQEAVSVTVHSDLEPFKSAPVKSTDMILHPDYEQSVSSVKDLSGAPTKFTSVEKAYADVAIVKFAESSAPAAMIAKIAATPAKAGDAVYIVGYGTSKASSSSTTGVRRVGTAKISSVLSKEEKQLIIVQGSASPAASGESTFGAGDQGGPLYNAAGEIVGIASVTLLTETRKSHFANLAATETRSFIDESAGLTSTASKGSSTTNKTANQGGEKSETANQGGEKVAEAKCWSGKNLVVTINDAGTPKTTSLSSCKVEVSCAGTALTFKAGSSNTVVSSSLTVSTAEICKQAEKELKADLAS